MGVTSGLWSHRDGLPSGRSGDISTSNQGGWLNAHKNLSNSTSSSNYGCFNFVHKGSPKYFLVIALDCIFLSLFGNRFTQYFVIYFNFVIKKTICSFIAP